jgi:hypothetical protein
MCRHPISNIAFPQTFDSITCQLIPQTVEHTPAVVYGGSGKYEKIPTGVVGGVTLSTTKLSAPTMVSNRYNYYQNAPISYLTDIDVTYIKKNGYLHYSLL